MDTLIKTTFKQNLFKIIFILLIVLLIIAPNYSDASISLNVGEKVEVYGTQPKSTLNVRNTWGTSSDVIGEKYWGSTGTIIDGPQYADGYTWWKVQWDNNENVSDYYYKPPAGWSAGDYLWSYDIDRRVRGVDISHWNTIIDWSTIYKSDRCFALIKATEGYGGDASLHLNFLDDNAPLANEAGLLVGVWHYARPDLNSTNNEARKEADWFVDNAKNYLTTDYLMPALDLETTNGSFSSLASWVNAWMEEVKLKANLTSYPILYCSQSYASGLYSADPTHMIEYPLWIVDLSTDDPNTYYGWSQWSFRQYAGDINAIANTAGRYLDRCPGFANDTGIDLDIYNGDINSLRSNFLIQTSTDNSPVVETFNVTPTSVTLGDSFNISYTVSDDIGLQQTELWRVNDVGGEPGDWDTLDNPIFTKVLSGEENYSGTFTDAPDTPGDYWYGIHVVDTSGNWSVEPDPPGPIMVTVTDPTVNPPTGVQASDGTYTDKIRINWNSVSGASYYHVYRTTSSGGYKNPIGSWQGSTTYDDTSATPGQTYYYFIKAATSSSGSNASDYSAYNEGWRKLSPPTEVQATDGTYTDKVRITWNSVSGASYYRVYRATSSGGSKTPLVSWQSSTTYDDTSATPGQTYYYFVKAATNSSGYRESDYSSYDQGSCSVSTAPPQATTSDASNITSTSVQLNGNLDSTGGLDCLVWFEHGKTTSYGISTVKKPKSTTGPFDEVINSLDANEVYHFRACASNSKGTVFGIDKIFSTSLLGDFGGPGGSPDCIVDFEDLMIFALAYGSTPSDANWNSVCDIASPDSPIPDGVIDFEDLMVFAMHYGDTCEDL